MPASGRTSRRQFRENLVFGLEPVGFAPYVEHVLLKQEQVLLGAGKNEDGRYVI